MIVYDLTCAVGHRFESWFQSAAAFDQQNAGRAVECPYCGNRDIGKAPMAPRISRRSSATAPAEPGAAEKDAAEKDAAEKAPDGGGEGSAGNLPGPPAALLELLGQMRRHVEANCDYVGAAFPEQARRIYYGEATARGIYGEASADEAEALREEGIETRKIPWLPRRNG